MAEVVEISLPSEQQNQPIPTQTFLDIKVYQSMFLFSISFLAFLCLLLYRCTLGDALFNVPGPFTASFSRLWLVYHSRRGDMHRIMIGLHGKYGKLVRTGPKEVSVSDLNAIKAIYGAPIQNRIFENSLIYQQLRDPSSGRVIGIASSRAIDSSISSGNEMKRYTPRSGVLSAVSTAWSL